MSGIYNAIRTAVIFGALGVCQCSTVHADFESLRKQYEKEIDTGPSHKKILDIVLEMGKEGDPAAIPFLREVSQMKLRSGYAIDIEVSETGEKYPTAIPTVSTAPGLAEVSLVLLGDEETFQRILERAHDEQLDVRFTSTRRLIMVGGERVVIPLLNLLEGVGWGLRYRIMEALDPIIEDAPWRYSDYKPEPNPIEFDRGISLLREWQAEHYPESMKDNLFLKKNDAGELIVVYPNRKAVANSQVNKGIDEIGESKSDFAGDRVGKSEGEGSTANRFYLFVGLTIAVLVFGVYLSRRKK